tara:strand:+ start:16 stop:393 length:378 start_codon:yes stop_codon:yes gene_type:complete
MDVLKRFPIKYVRDYIKKDYKIRDKCFICGSKENLELHHLYSLSQLWEAWCREHNLKKVESVEIIKQLRITFADDNKQFLNNKNLYTLCKTHHLKLHTLYGQNYSNHLVPKVKKWLELQREKVIG